MILSGESRVVSILHKYGCLPVQGKHLLLHVKIQSLVSQKIWKNVASSMEIRAIFKLVFMILKTNPSRSLIVKILKNNNRQDGDDALEYKFAKN